MHSDNCNVPLIMREEGRCIESLIAFHDGISFFFITIVSNSLDIITFRE